METNYKLSAPSDILAFDEIKPFILKIEEKFKEHLNREQGKINAKQIVIIVDEKSKNQ